MHKPVFLDVRANTRRLSQAICLRSASGIDSPYGFLYPYTHWDVVRFLGSSIGLEVP